MYLYIYIYICRGHLSHCTRKLPWESKQNASVTFWVVGAGDQIYATSWLQTILPTERTWMIHFEASLDFFLASSISTFFEFFRRNGPNLKVPCSTKKTKQWSKLGDKHPRQTTFRRNKTKTWHSHQPSIDFPPTQQSAWLVWRSKMQPGQNVDESSGNF